MQGFQNYLRWSIAFTPVGNMSVINMYNGMFQVVAFQVVDYDLAVWSELSRKAVCNLFK